MCIGLAGENLGWVATRGDTEDDSFTFKIKAESGFIPQQ